MSALTSVVRTCVLMLHLLPPQAFTLMHNNGRVWGTHATTHTQIHTCFKLQVEHFEICMSVSFAYKPTIKSINSSPSFSASSFSCSFNNAQAKCCPPHYPSTQQTHALQNLHRLTLQLVQSCAFALSLIVFKCLFYVTHVFLCSITTTLYARNCQHIFALVLFFSLLPFSVLL